MSAMQSRCPHCGKSVEVPERQADVLCPSCQRYFLWMPDSEEEADEETSSLNDSERNALHSVIKRSTEYASLQTAETAGEEDSSQSELPDAERLSVGLYNTYTPGGKKEPERKYAGPKTGKNMYPYELPGQVVEADRRMPVYSSMMSDAFTILCYNTARMIYAITVFAVMFTLLAAAYGASVYFLGKLFVSFPLLNLSVIYTAYVVDFIIATLFLVWILNGQCRYIISLIRYGKTKSSLLFSGTSGLFRNFVVFWIHLSSLFFPVAVGVYYYFWWFYGGDTDTVRQTLGTFSYVIAQTPSAVAAATAIMGFGIFLVIILNWGLSYWLILDKDLALVESLDVSHKVTYEKKATFLAILFSSIGGVLLLTLCSFGFGIVFFPIALLFVGMYYMKTAIQEMVIPGKTALGAHTSLYGDDGELSDKSDEEEDIL